MDFFFSWDMLASFSGASLAALVITQFIKKPLSMIPTQIISYIVSLTLLLLATAATKSASNWSDWAIIPFNAVLISLASNGQYVAIERLKSNTK